MDEHVVLALVIILFILAFLLEKLINLYGDKRQKNTKKPTLTAQVAPVFFWTYLGLQLRGYAGT
jgi:hypothetical protein